MDPHRPPHSLDSVHDAHNDEQHDIQPIPGHTVPAEHPFVTQPAPVSADSQQPELSEDVLMHDSVYDSMPELQSVSDSDSDREADEVEMQAVDADAQDDGGPAAPITREDIDIVFDSFRATPLQTPSSESTGGDNSRPNRRARVEDDDDEERDRRHPSQRVNDPSNSSAPSASTSSFTPAPSTPSQSATPTPPPPHRHHHHHHHHLPPNTYFSAAIGIPRRQGDSPVLRLFQRVDGDNTNNNASNNSGAIPSNPATPAPAAGPSGSVPAGPANNDNNNNNTNANPTLQAPLPPQQPAGRPPRVIEGLTLAFEFGPHGLVMTNPPPRNAPTNLPQGAPNATANADGDQPPPLDPPTVPNSPTNANANTNGPRPVNLTNLFTNLMARFAGGAGAGGAAGVVPGGDFEGPQFAPININLNLGDGVPFPFPFVSGFGQEKDDPERAKRLVEGLEEVPVGLVRRLERVGGTGGGMGEDSMAGGDAGCAICWDRLLDPDAEGFGKEKESETEKSTQTEEGGEAASDESAEGSSSSTKESANEEKKYPKIVSLPCAHVFHADCLIPWFSRPRHTTCPTCRFNIDPDNLTYVSASQRRRREREEAERRRTEGGEEPANAAENNAARDGENEVDDPFASINAAIQRAANNAAAATPAPAPHPQPAGTPPPAPAAPTAGAPASATPAPASAGAASAPGTGADGAPRPGPGMQTAMIQTPQGTVNVIQVPIPIVIPVQVPVGAPRQTARRPGTPIGAPTQPQPQQGAPAQAPPQPAPAHQPRQQGQQPPQQPQGGNSDFGRFLSHLFQTALGAAAGAVNGAGAPPTPPGGGAPGVGAGAAGPIGAPPLPMPVPNGWQYMGSAVFNGTFGLGGPQGQGQAQGRAGQQGQQGQQPQGLNFNFPGMTGTNVQMGPLPPGFNFPAGFPFNIPPANPQPDAAPAAPAANNNNAAPATPPTNNAPVASQPQPQPQPNPPANATNIPGQPAGLPPPVNPFSHRLGQPGMPPLPGVVGYTIDMVIDGPAGTFSGLPGFPPLGTFGAAQPQGQAQGQAQGAAGARDVTPPPELVFEGAQMVIDLDEDGPAPAGDNNNGGNNGNNERPEIARMRNLEEIFDLIEQDDRELEMQAQQDTMLAALLNQRQGQAQQQGQAPAPAGQGQPPQQPHGHGLMFTNAPPPLFGGGPLPAGVHIAAGAGRTVQEAWGRLFNTMRQPQPGQGQTPPAAQGTQPQAQAGDAPAAQGQQPQQQGQTQGPPPMGPVPPPPGFRMFTSFADFMNGGAPERDNRPKRTWTLPPAPGPTLRQRIERKEREAGLRCSDVSCGIGPSDEEPFGSSESEGANFKQLSIMSRKGDGEAMCPHTFHSSCLVTAERVALSAKGTEEVVETEDGKVEVSCPVCRGVGCVSREEWDEGVGALAALALA